MSNLFKYTKRVLTSVLAAAVVLTAIPSTAFGAELDEDLAVVDVQEEVAESPEVEEEALTVDGASGDPEVIVEEEGEDGPDTYTNDATLTLNNYNAAHAGIFAISGDSASEAGKTDANIPVNYDSELGTTIYIVPEMGYELVDGTDNLGAVKEIAGSFRYTGDASATTDMSDAYTITRGISLPNVTVGGYDFTNVQKVEFNTTSGIARAFKAYKEKASDLVAAPTLSIELKGTKGADAAKAGTINVKLKKADGTISAFGNATYNTKYGPKALADATDDWDNTKVSVILSNSEGKTGAYYKEYALAGSATDTTAGKGMDDTNAADAFYVDGTHQIWISKKGIKDAYEAVVADNSYTLSVVLETKPNTNIHTLTAETSDYYTLTGADITAGKVEKGSGTDYHYFTAALGGASKIGTSTIKITNVYYQVGDNDPVAAHPLSAADVAGTHTGKTAVDASGVGDYLILGTAFTADTVIWAEVAQNIKVDVSGATWSDSGTAKSAVAVTSTYSSATDVDIALNVTTLTKNATIVGNGDKFTFIVVPKTGYKIDSVKERVYDIKKANYSDFALTNLGNGKYETSALSTNAEILVKASSVDSQYLVKTADNYTSNAIFAGNATGAEFTNSGTQDAIAGEDYVFTITAKPGSYVDTVKYTMGMDSTEHPLTATADRQGVAKYTIPNVTGGITVTATFTTEKSARVERIANSMATVNVTGDGELKYVADPATGSYSAGYNDYVIADGRHPLAFTVATKESATVDKVYYKEASTAPTNTTGATEITPLGETYQIPASVITATSASNTIYIIVTTKKEVKETDAGAGFTVEWAGTAKPNRKEDIAKSGKLQLVGGGADVNTVLSDADKKTAAGLAELDIAARETVSASFKTTAGKAISGTVTYALGKVAPATDVVATISTATITSAKAYGEDKVTATLTSSGFPHSIKYTAELPLEVAALNTVFDEEKLAMTYSVTNGTGASNDTVAKAGLTVTEGKIRAISASSDANDVVTLTPKYTDKNKAVKTLVHNVAGTSIIKGITWKATNGDFTYSTSKLNPEFVVYKAATPATPMGSATENDTASIATAQKKQDIDVTATIEYLDGSKDTLAGKVNVVEPALGYFAVPTVTVGDAKDYNPGTVAIEAKTGGLNTASVTYDVYRVDAYTNAISTGITSANLAALNEDAIETLENAQSIQKVTSGVTFGAMAKSPSTDASLTVTGSNPYTATAVKKGTAVGLTPSIVVNGMTAAAAPLTATVYGELVGYTVTLNTDDSSNTAQVGSGATYTAPLLSDNAAWLSRTPVGKTLPSGAKTVTAYVYENVPNGTTLVLPTEADFNIKTFKPQVKLWAWEVSGSGATTYVKPGGKYTINTTMDDTTFTPIWTDRYTDLSGGYAAGVSVVNSASEGLLDNSAVLEIAKGYNVPVTIGFYELDMNESPNAGSPVLKKDPTYVTAGMTLTGNEAADSYLTLTDNKISAVGSVVGDNPVVTIKYTENKGADNEAVYVPTNLPSQVGTIGGYTGLAAGEIVVPVQSTPTEYAVTANAITLESTQTKSVEFTIEAGTAKTKKYKKVSGDNIADVKVISNNDKVVVGAYDATNSDSSHNYVALAGLSTGSTTVKIQITDAFGVVKESDPINVTVSAPTKEIVAVNSSSATDDELDATYGFTVLPWDGSTSAANITAALAARTMTFKIKESNALLNKPVSEWEVANTTDEDVVKSGLRSIDSSKDNDNYNPAGSDVQKAQQGFAHGAKLVGSNGEIAIWSTADFGTGEITVTWHESAKSSYTRVVPVTSCFTFKYKVDDNVGTPTTKKFTTYNGTTEKKADFTQKVIYNGSASYTVPDSDKIVASWDDEGKKDFLGWKAILPSALTDPNEKYEDNCAGYASATSADFAAGEAITLKKTELTNVILYAQFSEPQVAVTGLPESITITDETISSTTAAGTDAKAYIIDVAPKTSLVNVTIDAEDSNLITLDGSDKEKNVESGRTLYVKPTDLTPGQTVVFTNTVATDPSVTTRTHTFTVGKRSATTPVTSALVGETKLVVAYGTETKKIPVYVNGEYQFAAATGTTPAVYHYMENGKDLESGMRVVAGKEHYYADSKKITEGVVTIDGGKMVLIVNGDRITKAGERAVGSDKYYVGNDGFVKVDEMFNGLTTGDANKTYYAGKDGKLVANELVEISGKTYYFQADATMAKAPSTANKFAKVGDFYVNAEGEVAKGGIYVVDGINRLFRDNATIVSYAESDVVDGKIKVGNITYKIDPTTSEATPDKKMVDARLSWTVSWPKTWKNGDAVPTGHYEITYKFEGESTTQPAIVGPTVSAAQDPAVIGLGVKKVTFTFVAPAADLDGFFSDSKGTVALTDSGVKKTYTFNSSGTGTSGGIEINGFEEGQEFKFTGGAIKPVITVTDNDLGEDLVNGVDYSISYKNNTKITTDSSKMPTVTVNGKGNYAGKTVTRTFKIVSPTEGMSDLVAAVKKIDAVSFGSATPTYNGEAWYPETITVDGIVFEHGTGEDYTPKTTAKDVAFSFANNVDAGTATVAATGADGKTKKKTFKINKVDLSAAGSALVIEPDDVDWAVKGAVPNVTVTYTPEGGSAITLVPGQDFTVKVNYADRKKNVADGNTVTISGKGTNFTKKATSTDTFAIKQLTLSDASIFSVTAYAGQKVSAAKAIVIDGTGATIAKSNYTVNVYDKDMNVITDKNAKFVDGQDYTYEVVAPTTGNLDGSGQFKFKAATNMNSAKVTLSGLAKDGVEYTGEPIYLTQVQNGELIANLFTNGNIKVQYKNSSKQWVDLVYDEDFVVTGYVNNTKKGTMTVYISAKSDNGKVSGTKSFKVKIKAKTMRKAD